MAKNYTTKTSALKATTIDVRNIEATGTIDATKVVADTLQVGDKNVMTEIENAKTAANNAAISVGRDADKNWAVDETAIDMVKKISFLGDYVNVVEVDAPNGGKEVKLYIGENKSLPEAKKTEISGVPSTTKEVLLYSDATDDFALPVTANSTKQASIIAKDGSNFGSATLIAKSTTDKEYFTLDSTDFIWVRTTYEGTASNWGKVSLAKNRGTYNNGGSTPTASSVSRVAFSADASAGELALPSGVTMQVGNYVLTAENDAKNGKVPGRCETSFRIILNWDTILTKDGGTVKVEWCISPAVKAGNAPVNTANSFTRFFTEYKDVSMSSTETKVDIATPLLSDAVSGLKYNTAGTTVTVTSGVISNSQYKSSNKDKTRLVVDAAGTPTTYTTDSTALTVVGDKTTSTATYQLKDATLTLGSTGTGSATVTLTPYGYTNGTAQSKTVSEFWGSIPTSTNTTENFGVETTYRMLSPTSTPGSYPNTEDVTEHSIDVNGTTCCSAVCQYGSLYHPASAAVDAEGTDYDTDLPACFIRTFTGDKKPNTFTLKGSNLIQKNKVQVWWKDGNNWYDLSTAVSGSVAHSGSNQITKTIKTADGENSRTDMTIAIVVQPGASAIGALTATFA